MCDDFKSVISQCVLVFVVESKLVILRQTHTYPSINLHFCRWSHTFVWLKPMKSPFWCHWFPHFSPIFLRFSQIFSDFCQIFMASPGVSHGFPPGLGLAAPGPCGGPQPRLGAVRHRRVARDLGGDAFGPRGAKHDARKSNQFEWYT